MSHGDEARWAKLMHAASRGDQTAYRSLLEEVAPVLRGLVRTRGRHLGLAAADIEDVVQETLLAIHLKRHTWREDEPIRPWLFAITRYKIIDAFRRKGRHVDLSIEHFAETLPAAEPEDPTLRGDMDRVISRLDRRSTEIVRAIGLEGMSIAEASARFSISEGAVRVALHRALKKLAGLRKRVTE